MRKYRHVIIGAGPAGLGAAYRLKDLGEADFLVLESASRAGGLSASFRDSNGFTWDIGGHVLFSRDAVFLEFMDRLISREGWLDHERAAFVRLLGRSIPYPLQNNIRHLPPALLSACLRDLEESNARSRGLSSDFLQWLKAHFGESLTELFFRPYNEKVWAYPPEKLSSTWVNDRVAPVDVGRIRRSIETQSDDAGWGPNLRFRFPARGGTGAIWTAVATLVGEERIQYGAHVAGIDADLHEVILSSGERIGYGELLSTMPLTELCRSVSGRAVDRRALLESRRLLHSSCDVIGIGVRGEAPEALKSKSWIYFPEGNCPFYRVTVFSNYSLSHVPEGQSAWSLLAEVASSTERALPPDLLSEVVKGLLATGLLEPSDEIISKWHYRAEYAYPTPTPDRDEVLAVVLPELERHGIFSRGRFGGWKYEEGNQDHSCMQGWAWAQRTRPSK